VNYATNGETVLVTNGTYHLTNQITVTQSITLCSVNGYSNTMVVGNGANRCFYISCQSGRPTIDGFTITNGYANSNDFSGKGGGIFISTGNVYNCLITGNTVERGTNADWYTTGGGGVYLDSMCTVLTCIVRGNYSGYAGGGMVLGRYDGRNFISNCVIESNICDYIGGGIFGDGTLLNSTIVNNISKSEAGGIYGPRIWITNCVIAGNSATNGPGGGAELFYYSTIADSVISNNSAGGTSGGRGGGVYFYPTAPSPQIINSVIVNNSARLYGGGVYFNQCGILKQCLIKNNSISATGGSGCDGAGIYLRNVKNYSGYCESCTIVSNMTPHRGGGIAVEGTNNNYSVSNCVVWGNIGTVAGNDVFDESGTNNSPSFRFTCANYTNFPAGEGNITNDPQFVNFSGGNFHLKAASPCMNAGSNQDWMTNAVDFDGRQRIRYGIVDLGCYETIYEGTIYRFGF